MSDSDTDSEDTVEETQQPLVESEPKMDTAQTNVTQADDKKEKETKAKTDKKYVEELKSEV